MTQADLTDELGLDLTLALPSVPLRDSHRPKGQAFRYLIHTTSEGSPWIWE